MDLFRIFDGATIEHGFNFVYLEHMQSGCRLSWMITGRLVSCFHVLLGRLDQKRIIPLELELSDVNDGGIRQRATGVSALRSTIF